MWFHTRINMLSSVITVVNCKSGDKFHDLNNFNLSLLWLNNLKYALVKFLVKNWQAFWTVESLDITIIRHRTLLFLCEVDEYGSG